MDIDHDELDLLSAAELDQRYANLSDIDEFIAKTADYQAGRLSPEAYRAYRLTRGVYGQRQPDAYMLRLKIPGGIVLPDQLQVIADLTEAAPEPIAHITTRENIQIHHFALGEVEPWLRRLAEVGVTTTEACGNTVRNITQDPWAGLAPDEPFDTTPYLQAIVRFFLRNPRAHGMPRKFKMAVSTSPADRAMAAIHDVGLVACLGDDGLPAFKVLVAGGLASMPRSGLELHAAWPAVDILTPILAVIDFFQAHGNRTIRSKARIKHVLRKMGDAAFAAKYREYLELVQKDPPPRLDIAAKLHPPARPWSLTTMQLPAELVEWARSAVRPTRLPGLVFVTIRIDQGGALSPADLRNLANLAQRYGQGWLQLTPQQNALLRAVPTEQLPQLYADLQRAGLAKAGAGTAADITSCPGASTCALALTFSRNLAERVAALVEERPDGDVSIKISGCHNACGQHHVATVGFHGALRRVDGRPAPHYRMMVGGQVGPQGAIFGADLGLIPAQRAVTALARVLELADAHAAPGQSAGDWLRSRPVGELTQAIDDLRELDRSATELDFWDLGATAPFLGEATGPGECAA
ncbi:MAG: nitrite/sulfite reductase [Deltaproteobacteria bacterium]|nr:nitrite/sulfite reductase [Deltaproteobacteria bacterium]